MINQANKKKFIVSFLSLLVLFIGIIMLLYSPTNDLVTASAYDENIQLTQGCDHTQQITPYKRGSTGTRSFSSSIWIECTSSGTFLLEIYCSVPVTFTYYCYLVDSNSSTTGDLLGSFGSSTGKYNVELETGKYLYISLSSVSYSQNYISSDLHIILPTSDPIQLSAPVLEYISEYSLLSWSSVSNASSYELQNVNTGDIVYSGTLMQYSYTATSNATTFQVRAVGAGSSYSTSDWSNTVTVQAQSTDPIQLTAPVLSYDSSQNLLSWTATNDGGDYRLYNETTGVIAAETMYTSFTVTESGVYKVKALGDGDSTEDSSWSNSVTVDLSSTPIPLTAPVLSFSSSSNLLSWSYPDGTSFVDHAVVVNSNGFSKQYSTSVSGFSPSESGIYNVYLVAKSGSGYSDSAYSNSVTVTLSSPSSPTTLASPVLSYDSSQNLLSWTVTNDGGDYQLYNETTGSIATETMLTDFYPSVSGVYKVKALGDGDSTEDSAWSNTVLVSVPESILSSPSLNLSGKVLSWTSSGAGITYEVNNVTTGDTYTTQSLTFTVSVLGIYRVRATGDPGSSWSNTVFVDISSGSDRYGLGYNDGYAAGFSDGMLKASEGGGLRDLFLSIGDVPLHVIDGLLGGAALEDVFGFNLKTTFLTILVVLIIALLVRKFVGL